MMLKGTRGHSRACNGQPPTHHPVGDDGKKEHGDDPDRYEVAEDFRKEEDRHPIETAVYLVSGNYDNNYDNLLIYS